MVNLILNSTADGNWFTTARELSYASVIPFSALIISLLHLLSAKIFTKKEFKNNFVYKFFALNAASDAGENASSSLWCQKRHSLKAIVVTITTVSAIYNMPILYSKGSSKNTTLALLTNDHFIMATQYLPHLLALAIVIYYNSLLVILIKRKSAANSHKMELIRGSRESECKTPTVSFKHSGKKLTLMIIRLTVLFIVDQIIIIIALTIYFLWDMKSEFMKNIFFMIHVSFIPIHLAYILMYTRFNRVFKYEFKLFFLRIVCKH